jgi:hypothetical protein
VVVALVALVPVPVLATTTTAPARLQLLRQQPRTTAWPRARLWQRGRRRLKLLGLLLTLQQLRARITTTTTTN